MKSDRIEIMAEDGCRYIQTTWDKNIDNICKQNDVAVVVKLKTPYMTDIVKNNKITYLRLNYTNLGKTIIIPIPKSPKEIIVDQEPIYTTIVVKKGDNE